MGMLKQLGRQRRAELMKQKAVQLSKELQRWYGTHLISPWQGDRVKEIRAVYEEKQKGLDLAHDHASSRLSEEFMQFELDFLAASQKFKDDNPGKEWHPEGIKGIFHKAFWHNIWRKGAALGLNLGADKEDGQESK